MQKLNIVIPMAGRGQRFVDAGYVRPKPLILIDGKPMIEWVVNNIAPSIDHQFIFVCQQLHVERYALDSVLGEICDNPIIIPINNITQGAACTVLCAKEYINNDQPLMIANSDQWLDFDIDDYITSWRSDEVEGYIMTMTSSENKWSYIKYGAHNEVIGVVEKEVVSDEATTGIYNFNKGSLFVKYASQMVQEGKKSKGEYYVAPIYDYFSADNKHFDFFNIGQDRTTMFGLGTPQDLEHFCSVKKFTLSEC